MGCGGSRLGGAVGRSGEGGVMPLPVGIRPLLRRRLEEIKKRSHASVLKGNHTLSKKELLHQDSEDGEETEGNDGSLNSTSKVAPMFDHHVEEKRGVIYEMVSSKDDVIEVKEQEVVNKQEEENQNQQVLKKQEQEEIQNQEVVTKEEKEDYIDDNEAIINAKKEEDEDEDEDEGRMSNFDERMIIGPGSPSFRVYCIDVTSSDDDEEKGKDGEGMRKSMETESISTEPKEDESIVKKEKRQRKGKRFGMVGMGLPKKYFANVTAPCYAGGGCMGNTHSRLVQEKSRQ